ncbi:MULTISPECIES: hypothetical protein [unclassified Bosea (in: a-proteobacteria)]|uniref:hypothetical protein n=1 Tax=unclassified Bosea (in: a-proteobacteria) TaxID=2653178 RepID=UPI000F75E705|nr:MULTISPECIES: hypothetical protein [unclassified Bosea (in: a-proteobacteria)]AZO76932.1 hypothetical protein BLM15_04370 [Bosea sp. Tri-49]RXT21770.1 hypothetical protein B5U98_14995 [Bosea sp. Tri-39]RXT32109.1 hypothetical protein B5U99_25840 [Bosea sp. Tri-54]
MEALVLCEIAAGREDLREALLARIGRLGLHGRAKLNFVARDRDLGDGVILAVAFPRQAEAERFVVEAIGDGLGPTALRLLTLEAVWQAEPLPLMFP